MTLFTGCSSSKKNVRFYTNTHTINLVCGDATKHDYYKSGNRYLSNVTFTQKGLDKLCSSTTNSMGERFSMKVGEEVVISSIKIGTTIGCSKLKTIGLAFNSMEQIQVFNETLCIRDK
jgi:hypothetical protein